MTLFAGLMSGTSMDGVDAVLVDVGNAGDSGPCRIETLGGVHLACPADLASRLQRAVTDPDALRLDELCSLDVEVARWFASAVQRLLEQQGLGAADVRAIGSHGQTLRHKPKAATPFTLQIGDPNVLAEATGIDVVADFRRRDVAAGGEGAPLVPAFHAAVFNAPGVARVVANIGGIANVTVIDASGHVSGWDTGPGNCLLDGWCRQHHALAFDRDGRLAASGRVDDDLLAALLAEPYFNRNAPKSTGRELFNEGWLKGFAGRFPSRSEDMLATLCELTAASLAQAIRSSTGDRLDAVYVCGGGVHNAHLMARLAKHMPGTVLRSTQALGLDPQWVEAAAFAWLAHQRVEGRAGNVPAVTGAVGYRPLGGLYLGRCGSAPA